MIAIIDYDAGNLTSVKRALDYLGIQSEITPDPDKIITSERIIFPGVGHAASAMNTIINRGLDQALTESYSNGTPILGICLGTQIILSHSTEGDTNCLGLIEGNCPKFELKNTELKIPHMGWNQIKKLSDHPILDSVDPGDEFYFVHSYYPVPSSDQHILGTSEYGLEFSSVIGHKSLIAMQFHPEKSGVPGLRILKNFCDWNGNT